MGRAFTRGLFVLVANPRSRSARHELRTSADHRTGACLRPAITGRRHPVRLARMHRACAGDSPSRALRFHRRQRLAMWGGPARHGACARRRRLVRRLGAGPHGRPLGRGPGCGGPAGALPARVFELERGLHRGALLEAAVGPGLLAQLLPCLVGGIGELARAPRLALGRLQPLAGTLERLLGCTQTPRGGLILLPGLRDRLRGSGLLPGSSRFCAFAAGLHARIFFELSVFLQFHIATDQMPEAEKVIHRSCA